MSKFVKRASDANVKKSDVIICNCIFNVKLN
ncbi:Uncharacterised protein [Burkholderia oklahomensis]|nr:hypothetical protein BG90_978 [Burkholderia oklahomensis C6786]SUW59601.1 Uncharacterised protein [Burkholderia oklahomensis]